MVDMIGIFLSIDMDFGGFRVDDLTAIEGNSRASSGITGSREAQEQDDVKLTCL